MKARCESKSCRNYPIYGGRGIKICKRWQTFENFLSDMGERPSGMSIDRIDNDLGYNKDNCRWASMITQARNRRGIKRITFNGTTKCIGEWAETLGLKHVTLRARLKRGWGLEAAFKKPVRDVTACR